MIVHFCGARCLFSTRKKARVRWTSWQITAQQIAKEFVSWTLRDHLSLKSAILVTISHSHNSYLWLVQFSEALEIVLCSHFYTPCRKEAPRSVIQCIINGTIRSSSATLVLNHHIIVVDLFLFRRQLILRHYQRRMNSFVWLLLKLLLRVIILAVFCAILRNLKLLAFGNLLSLISYHSTTHIVWMLSDSVQFLLSRNGWWRVVSTVGIQIICSNIFQPKQRIWLFLLLWKVVSASILISSSTT